MGLVKHLCQKWKNRLADKKTARWCEKHEMLFDTPLGLSIGGYPVSEFEYLLARYSGYRIPNFEDLALVSLHANAMRFIIQLDYNNPLEHRELGLHLAVARANLDRLVQVITIIDEYVQFCTVLGCRERFR